MEFEDHNEEEQEEGYRRSSSPPPIPLSLSFPSIRKKPTATATSRYMECLKNHAARIGGHALDGCREFMPAGAEGSVEALICAACNCHRNFHRKEAVDPTPDQQQIQLPQIACYNYQQQQRAHPAALFRFYPCGKTRPPGGKRFRTKFTEEQKERMRELAERLGWRLHKEDEAAVRRFCQETGLSRRVLKVWMHNHKQTLGKKLTPP